MQIIANAYSEIEPPDFFLGGQVICSDALCSVKILLPSVCSYIKSSSPTTSHIINVPCWN
jgi:hypothetical protein